MARPSQAALFAAWLGAAVLAPVAAGATEPAPLAAVLPTAGAFPATALKGVTSEFRARLRGHGYRLALQRDVRAAASRAGIGAAVPTPAQLGAVARELGAELVVAPRLTGRPARGLRIVVRAVDAAARPRGPVAVELRRAAGVALGRDDLRRAVAAAVARIAAAPADDVTDAPKPRLMEDYDKGELHDYDHSGLIIDLGFAVAWCFGETLCRSAETGYGGRLRIGFRPIAQLALAVSGAAAGHDVSPTTDAAELARSNRAFAWYGVFGGLRYHPVNRHWFDPFVGLDLGWSRIHYSEKVRPTDAAEDPGNPDLPDELPDWLAGEETRTSLTMDGFAFAPHLGLNFFVTRNVALALVAEWILPIWSRACNEWSVVDAAAAAEDGVECIRVDDADEEFLRPENGVLSDRSELPRFFSLQANLVFGF